VQTGCLGALFAVLTLWRGSIWPAIAAHAGINVTGYLLILALESQLGGDLLIGTGERDGLAQRVEVHLREHCHAEGLHRQHSLRGIRRRIRLLRNGLRKGLR